jgi:hypothetical protein
LWAAEEEGFVTQEEWAKHQPNLSPEAC